MLPESINPSAYEAYFYLGFNSGLSACFISLLIDQQVLSWFVLGRFSRAALFSVSPHFSALPREVAYPTKGSGKEGYSAFPSQGVGQLTFPRKHTLIPKQNRVTLFPAQDIEFAMAFPYHFLN